MNRVSIKVAGQSGQGINVVGEILAKAFKRSGYYTFGYREYPSLIKGGHASYQIDVSDKQILSSNKLIDILVVQNRQATKWYLEDMKQDSVILHDIENPRINEAEYEIIKQKNIKFVFIPSLKLSVESGGNEVTSNIVTVGSLWKFFGLEKNVVLEVVRRTFEAKPKYLEIDLKCLEAGYTYATFESPPFTKRLMKEDEISHEEKNALHLKTNTKGLFSAFSQNIQLAENYLMTGNDAIGFGAISSGVRIFYSYPMTPASSLLEFLADHEKQSGMIVKQVEDEITAAAMTIGSMHMGVRAMTGTSGGGFDLMIEHISLAGMLEVPFVCVLGQRPGPATGLPTWTAQGDLLPAIFSGHGEFPKCVMSVNSAEDAFYTTQIAMNIAEKFQIPVILLTDKLIAESIYQLEELDTEHIKIERGEIQTAQNAAVENSQTLKRYQLTENGISPRWFPGDKLTDFNSNSDEHDEVGNVTEESEMSLQMIAKRMKKMEKLLNELPDPVVFSNNPKTIIKTLNLIGWGSTFTVVSDVMQVLEEQNVKVNYMDIKYLWPLKTETIQSYISQPDIILIEGNHNSQLAQLIKMQTGVDIHKRVNRWDGRPFFVDELAEYLLNL